MNTNGAYTREIVVELISTNVPVAQWIERWPPEPEAGVRVSPGTLFSLVWERSIFLKPTPLQSRGVGVYTNLEIH